jgi:hypothetical protein
MGEWLMPLVSKPIIAWSFLSAILLIFIGIILVAKLTNDALRFDELKELIRNDVRIGMKKTALKDWLQAHDLTYSEFNGFSKKDIDHFSGETIVDIAGLHISEPFNYLRVLIQQSGFDNYVYFFFDQNGLLEGHYVYSVRWAL